MSTRAQHRAAFMTAIEVIDLGRNDVTVERWTGAEAALNSAAGFPYVAVGSPPAELPRASFSELLEVGLESSYEREFRIAVYVATESTESEDAEDAADAILEAIEAGLIGQALSTGPLVEPLSGSPGAEACLVREMDRALYIQLWRVREVLSR